MAHPVPDDGDRVEVDRGGETHEGTVVEARSHYARVDLDGEELDCYHEDVGDLRDAPTYRLVDDEGDEGDDDVDQADDEGVSIPSDDDLEELEYRELQSLASDVEGVAGNDSKDEILAGLRAARDE